VAKRVSRRHGTMALLLLDLDGFKTANDTLGHAAGDTLLRAVAERLKATVPQGDLIARLGGDEFAVLLEDVDSPREVEALARSLGVAFQEPFQIGGHELSITTSIGITVCPPDSIDADNLLHNAETALKQAKQQGKNTFRFFGPGMHEKILSDYRFEAGLKAAIEQRQFVLLYQPQVRLADHRIEGVEALLHWKHPERGLLGPGEFMSAAEESGSILPICTWMIEEVCRQLQRWESAGVPLPRVGINVAAAQFRQPGFPDALRKTLQSHSVDPELIELEFTERALMDNPPGTRERLHALRDIGVRLAIDDFAGRHLSLADLRQLPLDVLKVGPSCVSDLDTSKDAQAVCGAIVSIAHGFLLDAVANGVTSDQQETFLAKHNCLYGQGEYYGAPVGADQIALKMAESGGQVTRRRRVPRKRAALKTG
jgi:diguanylate cyclase (GGDEF)-like protein